jgi:hypothetical protein
MLDTYNPQRPSIICPKCKKKGFLTKRWVMGSGYFVSCVSVHEFSPIFPKQNFVRVYEYTGKDFNYNDYHHRYEYACVDKHTGERHVCYVQVDEGSNTKILKRVIEILPHRKIMHYYIGHYDSKKYKEQMQKYKEGKIKSKPNGRRWCSVKASEVDLDRYKRQKSDYIESITIPIPVSPSLLPS